MYVNSYNITFNLGFSDEICGIVPFFAELCAVENPIVNCDVVNKQNVNRYCYKLC